MLRRLMLLCFINCHIGAQDTVTLQFTDNVTQQYKLAETKTMLKKQCPALANLFDENGRDVDPDTAIPFNLPSKAFNILQRMPAQFGTKDDVQQANSAKNKLLQLTQAQRLETIDFAHQYNASALLTLSVEAVLDTVGYPTLLDRFGSTVLTRIAQEVTTHPELTPALLYKPSTVLDASPYDTEDVEVVSWHPDGQSLLIAGTKTVSLYDYESGKMKATGKSVSCAPDTHLANCIWSPSGDRFILKATTRGNYYHEFALYDSNAQMLPPHENRLNRTFFADGLEAIWNHPGDLFIIKETRQPSELSLYNKDGQPVINTGEPTWSPINDNNLPTGTPTWSPTSSNLLIVESNRRNQDNELLGCTSWLYTTKDALFRPMDGRAQWSPDGQRILIELPDNLIKLYNAMGGLVNTGKPIIGRRAQWRSGGKYLTVEDLDNDNTKAYDNQGCFLWCTSADRKYRAIAEGFFLCGTEKGIYNDIDITPQLLQEVLLNKGQPADSTGGWYGMRKRKTLEIYGRNAECIAVYSEPPSKIMLRPCHNQPAFLGINKNHQAVLYRANLLSTLLSENVLFRALASTPTCTLLLQAWKEVRRHSPTCTLLLQE